MKKIFYSLIALLVLGWTDLNAQDYCTPKGNMHSNGKTYVKKIETTGLEQNLVKEWSSTPDNVFQLINEEINVYTGTTFNVIYTANEVGPRSTTVTYQDLRYTRAFIFTDWDGDGTFDKINTLGVASPSDKTTPNNVLANYDTVMNINQEFTVPENAYIGQVRIRIIYHNAWLGEATACMTNISDGMAYDIKVNVQPQSIPSRTVSVQSSGNGTANITSPAGGESGSIDTNMPVTIKATPNPGYKFANWTNGIDGPEMSTKNPFTYAGTEAITLVANFTEVLGINNGWKTELPSVNNNGRYSSGNYKRIEINDGIIGTGSSQSKSFTIESWVKIEKFTAPSEEYLNGTGNTLMGHRQICVYGYGSDPSFSVNLRSETEKGYNINIFSRTKNANNSFKASVLSSDSYELAVGEWQHLAFTGELDEENQLHYKLFVNGELVITFDITKDLTEIFNEQNSLPMLTDTYNNETSVFVFGEGFPAIFSDIMIWNKALTQNEIKTSMKGYTQVPDGLIGYYLLDETNSEGGCDNLGSATDYKIKITNLYLQSEINAEYFHFGDWGNAQNKVTRSFLNSTEVENYTMDITNERPEPRGGAKFYLNNTEVADEQWEKNGDELNFGYLVNSQKLTRLDYNGGKHVPLPEQAIAVYHNGDPGMPTYVTTSDIKAIDSSTATEPANSYVVGGIEYTMTMPSVAKTEWMPVSLPIGIDAVADITTDATKLLRPGYNFWYAQVSPDYLAINSGNIWETIKNQDGNYVLQPGIISVPEARINHKFTFFTQINKPVVIRKFNAQYNTSLLPEVGEMAFVQNPYGYKVNALKMAGIDAEGNGANLTIYRFNKTTGNFDPLDKTNIEAEGNTLNEFEPFFVHDSNNGVSQAPRYIGTKDVSGIVEFEAVYDVNVRGTENAVEVETFQNTEVQIYTLDGVMVAADEVEGTREFELPAGIYVVKTTVEGENKSFKVVVE